MRGEKTAIVRPLLPLPEDDMFREVKWSELIAYILVRYVRGRGDHKIEHIFVSLTEMKNWWYKLFN